MTYQKLREDKTGPQFSLIKLEGSEARIEAMQAAWFPLVKSRIFGAPSVQ